MTITVSGTVTGGFDTALAARPVRQTRQTRRAAARQPDTGHWLFDSDGHRVPLPVHRWHGAPEPAARALLRRCAGPTLDLGCGPGRLTVALARSGVTALGVDNSATAVRLTRLRGGAALQRDVFDPLPGEGRWSHVLLADGNIGIGGDPAALLHRCARLLRPGGTLLVELDAPDTGVWRGHAYVVTDRRDRPADRGPAFRWARLGADAVHRLATGARLTVRCVFQRDGRWFAEVAAA
jgi:SAM-dependent methyltransferase